MTYCTRCQGIILLEMPVKFLNGKEYHQVCALKEAYRNIPLEKKDENQHRPDERFVDTLPPS
jgi:hypothetical protein